MSKLNPKCLKGKDLAYVPSGHLTPCCWTNTSWNEPYLKEIFSDKMHIDNFNSVEEILSSKPWKRFFKMLKNNPENAPACCNTHCRVDTYIDTEGYKEKYD